MQIREGVCYKRNDGKTVGPAYRNEMPNEAYPWIVSGWLYTSGGKSYREGFDLIEEHLSGYYDDIDQARQALETNGGYLYDLGDGQYYVTDVHPAEFRSFGTTREAMDYAMRMAEAGYDETKARLAS